MLRSRKEYEDAREAAAALEERLPEERERWRGEGFGPEEVARMMEPMELRLAELRDEIELYERILGGDLSAFTEFEELGQALIAARIARGLTQRELAERVGVHESQVSRDERNEYRGVGTERLGELFEALGLEFHGAYRLAERTH